MSETNGTQVAMLSSTPPVPALDVEKETIKVALPTLDKGPASFYDTDTHAFWVGIPLDKTDPLIALTTLDRVKMDCLGFFNKMLEEKQKKSKIIAPTGMRAMMEGVVKKFQRR